jgi:hypothetical protein
MSRATVIMKTTVKTTRLLGTPEWVFPWQARKSRLMPHLAAVVVAGLFFALILKLRVQVATPVRTSPKLASVMVLRDDALGRSLSLRAEADGPFPSRFKLSQWQGMADLEAEAWESVNSRPRAHVSEIQQMADTTFLRPLALAVKGKSFFPQRVPEQESAPELGVSALRPNLFPLSGITFEDLPKELPPCDQVMEPVDGRFLLKLDSAGVVKDCISLENQEKTAPVALERWVRSITFLSSANKAVRWLALDIKFTHTLTDGPTAR